MVEAAGFEPAAADCKALESQANRTSSMWRQPRSRWQRRRQSQSAVALRWSAPCSDSKLDLEHRGPVGRPDSGVERASAACSPLNRGASDYLRSNIGPATRHFA